MQFIALTELADPAKGYVVDDTLELEARVILLEDMESMNSEEVTFDVRGTHFSVLKSSLQVRSWVRAGVCSLHLRLGLTHSLNVVQAYPNSLLCKLADDDAPDAVVLARSSDEEGQCKPIAIDRDAELFEQVLVTSLVNKVTRTPEEVDSVDGLWAELDFYGLLPMLKGGDLPIATGRRTMLPAALLKHERERIVSERADLVGMRVALELKMNTHTVSLIVSQMSELISRSLLTDAQHIRTCKDVSDALLIGGANLDGTDWSRPFENRLSLAPVPLSVNEETFCFVTGDDGQPRVVCANTYSDAMGTRKALENSGMRALLKTHLEQLGYTMTMDSPRTGNSLYTRITVSWK